MTILILLVIMILLLLAGHFKGKMDAVADEGIKNLDWSKKYNFTKLRGKPWWYFGLYEPKFPERFPFSTTILVFLTDRWHRNQFFMLRCFYLIMAILISSNLLIILLNAFVIMPVLVGIAFEVSYADHRDYISNRKRHYRDVTGDEPNDNSQVTSIPEKQITDK